MFFPGLAEQLAQQRDAAQLFNAERYAREVARNKAQRYREEVIKPTLDKLGLGGDAAEELMLGTAIVESDIVHRTQLNGGPGVGLYQVEVGTHNDIWATFLKYRPELAAKVSALLVSGNKLWNLRNNDVYATGIARTKYLRTEDPLPAAGNLAAQANYWKEHYNTYKGQGRGSTYVNKWEYHMGE